VTTPIAVITACGVPLVPIGAHVRAGQPIAPVGPCASGGQADHTSRSASACAAALPAVPRPTKPRRSTTPRGSGTLTPSALLCAGGRAVGHDDQRCRRPSRARGDVRGVPKRRRSPPLPHKRLTEPATRRQAKTCSIDRASIWLARRSDLLSAERRPPHPLRVREREPSRRSITCSQRTSRKRH
jgi:hypothetical protein